MVFTAYLKYLICYKQHFKILILIIHALMINQVLKLQLH